MDPVVALPDAEPRAPVGWRPWAILAASTAAQAASAVAIHGPAFLIPTLVEDRGLSLAEAGLVAAAPTLGVMCTLIAWGLLTDRRGERVVLLAGLLVTVVALVPATQVRDTVPLGLLLFVAGAAAASTSAASGRVVVGWFPAHRRGLAMGIRQMAQPVGVGIAAISIAVAAHELGIGAALWIPAGVSLVAAALVFIVVVDPPRPERTVEHTANPYRADSFLARIHGVSALLVVPQFFVWTFALVWLVQDRDWSPAAAGTLVALSQVAGALGRIAAGQLSDVVGSRTRPLRWVAMAAAATMALLGLLDAVGSPVAVAVMVAATAITVADNGLAFTAVAERAGPYWSGRALGTQNTAQFLTSALVPPVGGWVATEIGLTATWALVALFPLVAVALVPVRQERELS